MVAPAPSSPLAATRPATDASISSSLSLSSAPPATCAPALLALAPAAVALAALESVQSAVAGTAEAGILPLLEGRALEVPCITLAPAPGALSNPAEKSLGTSLLGLDPKLVAIESAATEGNSNLAGGGGSNLLQFETLGVAPRSEVPSSRSAVSPQLAASGPAGETGGSAAAPLSKWAPLSIGARTRPVALLASGIGASSLSPAVGSADSPSWKVLLLFAALPLGNSSTFLLSDMLSYLAAPRAVQATSAMGVPPRG
mmetsp:Transcript_87050/g.246783  ORF Transcript_87050/g.246783 Transcript_87050/m.246783 type:complete len:257 (-) Transcript_87050:70-840(-)